uniref:Glutathione-dependent dehydroascorbate reductase n=1 Tax=Plectus sambesii TaxID=2011161 RepID=A0A914VJ92_9BILA
MANFEGLNSITLNPGMASQNLFALSSVLVGDELPPLTSGRMRLYNMIFCPFAHRSILYISKKKLPVEVIDVNLMEKPDWFVQRNPLGKVPMIEHDGKVVYESLIVNEYLDELFPETAILPTDPYERAQQKILVERLSSVTGVFFAFMMNKDGDYTQAIESMEKALENAECLLVDEFYGDKTTGYADIDVWPIFERFPIITLNPKFGVKKIPGIKYPKVSTYIKRMKKQPEIQAVMKPVELHENFFKSAWIEKNPDYNLGI